MVSTIRGIIKINFSSDKPGILRTYSNPDHNRTYTAKQTDNGMFWEKCGLSHCKLQNNNNNNYDNYNKYNEPMDVTDHMRNNSNQISTHICAELRLYYNTLIKRENISCLRIEWSLLVKTCVMNVFSLCWYLIRLKRALPFNCTNLNPLYWRMFCVKFDWYLSSGSVEKDFEILSKHIRFFCYFSPWKRACLHLSKLESASFKDALCKDWLKLAQWFCKRSRKWGKFTDRHTMDDFRSLKLSAHVS